MMINEIKTSVSWEVSTLCRGLAGAAAELCSAWCDEIIGMSAETRSESGHTAQ